MPTRGGGGFGGGHSSGGSGGFSGGHSSGGSRPTGFGGSRPSGGPRPGSFGPPPGGFGPRPGGFRPRPGGFGPRPGGPRGGCGCGSGFVFVFILIVAIIIFGTVLGSFFRFQSPIWEYDPIYDETTESFIYTATDIPESTKKRTRLADSKCTPIDSYITDELNLLLDDVNVRQSMEYFYEITGVQPYLYLTEKINGIANPKASDIEDFAFETYGKLFGSDEGHLLIIYIPYTDYEYDFYTYYLPGDDAATVFDEEAGSILLACLDAFDYRWNSTVRTADETFTQTFRELADRLNIRQAAATVGSTRIPVSTFVWIGVAVVIVVAAVVLLIRRKHEKEAEIDDRPSAKD